MTELFHSGSPFVKSVVLQQIHDTPRSWVRERRSPLSKSVLVCDVRRFLP